MTEIKGPRNAAKKARAAGVVSRMIASIQMAMRQPTADRIAELRADFNKGSGHSLVNPLPPASLLQAFMSFDLHQHASTQVMVGRLVSVINEQQQEIDNLKTLMGVTDEEQSEDHVPEGQGQEPGQAQRDQGGEPGEGLGGGEAQGSAQPQGEDDGC